jgi:hypothetical protein
MVQEIKHESDGAKVLTRGKQKHQLVQRIYFFMVTYNTLKAHRKRG